MRGRLAVLMALALAGCGPQPAQTTSAPIEGVAQIGGPFTLTDTKGELVSEKDLLGKPTVMFFGFTYCPEVCPVTLAEITAAMKDIGRTADDLNVVFVSVDPERDTPEQMALYLSMFDPRIRGFTGTPEQIEAITKAYRIYYKKVPLENGGYTIDHTSAIYTFDKKGQFVAPIGYGESHERVVAALRSLARGA